MSFLSFGLVVYGEHLRNGDLSTNVAELRNETEYHVVLLVDWLITDDVTVLINADFQSVFGNDGSSSDSLLLDFGEFGKEEHYGNCGACTCDCQINLS